MKRKNFRELGRFDGERSGTHYPDTLGAMDALAEIVISRDELIRGLDLYEQILIPRKGCLVNSILETLSTLKAIARILRLQRFVYS